jgi:hypothetical protein
LHILIIDKKFGYKRKIKKALYNNYITRFNIEGKEKIVFDSNRFNKIKSIPREIYAIIDSEFLEKNASKFNNYMNFQKQMIDSEINVLNSEIESDINRIKGLESERNWTKQRICPMCNGNKSSTHKYCSDCWIKIRREQEEAFTPMIM